MCVCERGRERESVCERVCERGRGGVELDTVDNGQFSLCLSLSHTRTRAHTHTHKQTHTHIHTKGARFEVVELDTLDNGECV